MELKPGAFPICDPCADQVIAPLPSQTREPEPAAERPAERPAELFPYLSERHE